MWQIAQSGEGRFVPHICPLLHLPPLPLPPCHILTPQQVNSYRCMYMKLQVPHTTNAKALGNLPTLVADHNTCTRRYIHVCTYKMANIHVIIWQTDEKNSQNHGFWRMIINKESNRKYFIQAGMREWLLSLSHHTHSDRVLYAHTHTHTHTHKCAHLPAITLY